MPPARHQAGEPVSCRHAGARSAGKGEAKASGRPDSGWANASSAACSAWRSMPSTGPAAVEAVADQRQAARRQVHPDLMRAPGVQGAAQGAQGVVGGDPLDVGPRRLARGDDRHAQAHLRIAADRRLDAERRRRRLAVGDRQVAAAEPRGRRSRAPAPSPRPAVLPTTISPEVSLSRRWTMPARGSAALCGWRASRPLSSVPDQLPAAGCTTLPASLSMTSRSSSS